MAKEQKITDSEEQTPFDFGEILAAWEFHEHDIHQRGFWWYATCVVALIGVSIYAYFDQNPLFIVVLVLIAVTFIVSEWRGPDRHVFAITEDGLAAGEEFFPYEKIKNFYLIYQPPRVKMLYFDPKNLMRPVIGIPLEDQDPNIIREILLNFLTEDLSREDEPTSDYLGRLFKF